MSLTLTQQEVNQALGKSGKKAVNFKIDSLISISEQKVSSSCQKRKQKQTCLPINFFHAPGQYQKMLIRCAPPRKEDTLQRKVGVLKDLEFVNEELFSKQKQKRHIRGLQNAERLKQEKAAVRQNQKNMKKFSECTCCCCDNYCRQCAKLSSCGTSQKEIQLRKQDYLIDIEAIKRGQKSQPIFPQKKKKPKPVEASEDIQHAKIRCKSKDKRSIRIQQILNEALMRQIQVKRQKEIEALEKRQRQTLKESYNQRVRQHNRAHSAPKKPASIPLEPSKKDIGKAYWMSVKDLVAREVRKSNVIPSVLAQKQREMESPKRQFRMTMEEMHSLRILHGMEAMKQEQAPIKEKKKEEKMRAKKLMAIAAKQSEIIKKQKKRKFKPTQSMLQQAFKGLQ